MAAIASLARGTSVIRNFPDNNDSKAALCAAESFGSLVDIHGDEISITPGVKSPAYNFDAWESGLVLRLFSVLFASKGGEFTATGSGTLLNRDFSDLAGTLRGMGCRVKSDNDKIPLKISGKIKPGKYFFDFSSSSQTLTGLLIALPMLDSGSVLNIKGLTSKPYVNLTLNSLRKINSKFVNLNGSSFEISGQNNYNGFEAIIESDWSSAAYLLCAGAIAGNLVLREAGMESIQGDKKIIEILKSAGAKIKITGNTVEIGRGKLKGFEADCTDTPDLIPAITALALHCKGRSIIRGINRLQNKESDRAKSLLEEFVPSGGNIRRQGDFFIIEKSNFTGGKFNSHNDHRIAMALAIAALAGENSSVITGAECVKKSYPDFFNDLIKIGAKIK
jgi:3-phosphoshikimate 1-carboxyvinyltransferase